MRIIAVQTIAVDEKREDRPAWVAAAQVANPMSIYPRYKERRSSWTPAWGSDVLVRLVTDEGHVGLGSPIPAPARTIIDGHFARLLVGEDPFDIERLWDQLYRASLPYGRMGLPIMALSSIDIALWDILGKARQEPLWRLLGGKVRDTLPTYATGGDLAAARHAGFRAFKLPMPYGPADGWEGMRKNVATVEEARELVGHECDVMVDCFMGWDVDYTIRMAKLLEPFRVLWLEECLLPDDYDGYAFLTAHITSTKIATGEHEYTRWGFQRLVRGRCCHILQPDLAWVGGISEAKKVAAIASAWGLEVAPHAAGDQPWAVHYMASTTGLGWAECLNPGDTAADNVTTRRYPYFTGAPLVIDGVIAPTDSPGIGIDIDPALVSEAES